jgi:aminopeptidase
LAFVDPTLVLAAEKADVVYVIRAPSNTRALTGTEPARLAILEQAEQEYLQIFYLRAVMEQAAGTITAWPTHAFAQEAEMGLRAYREFFGRVCGLDRPDPVAYWSAFRERQMRLVNWLQGKRHVEIHGPGIDLGFDFADRPWISCHGDGNFPDGEIFTSPVEDSVNGQVAFNFPTVHGGRRVEGVRLTIEDGVVVAASADVGEDFLLAQLNIDTGARRLGEFAIGTNPDINQFTGHTLFDEKIGGTIHMALGYSLPEAFGENQSAIHWDMVHDMRGGGDITIDGTLFYRDGDFAIET